MSSPISMNTSSLSRYAANDQTTAIGQSGDVKRSSVSSGLHGIKNFFAKLFSRPETATQARHIETTNRFASASLTDQIRANPDMLGVRADINSVVGPGYVGDVRNNPDGDLHFHTEAQNKNVEFTASVDGIDFTPELLQELQMQSIQQQNQQRSEPIFVKEQFFTSPDFLGVGKRRPETDDCAPGYVGEIRSVRFGSKIPESAPEPEGIFQLPKEEPVQYAPPQENLFDNPPIDSTGEPQPIQVPI